MRRKTLGRYGAACAAAGIAVGLYALLQTASVVMVNAPAHMKSALLPPVPKKESLALPAPRTEKTEELPAKISGTDAVGEIVKPTAAKSPMPIPKLAPVAMPAPVTAIEMNMPSVVVVKCVFKNPDTGSRAIAFGSGAIVSSDGYVLTARHVVDMEYAYRVTGGKQGLGGYALESCAVGGPALGAHAPTPAEIRAINPFTNVDSLPYKAEVRLVPGKAASGMSDAERDFYDIAILKITDVTDDARKFFGIAMPASFPASRLIADSMPAAGEEIVTFGFPSGTPSYGNSFQLQGSVGTVTGYVGGDARFKDQPLGIDAEMETIGGRSGSPVFWRGYVIGVVSAKAEYSKSASAISVHPLEELLAGSGVALDGL